MNKDILEIKAEYESVKNKADNLKKIDTGEKANKLHLFSWAFTALSMLSIIFTGFNILTIIVFVLLFILSVILTFKIITLFNMGHRHITATFKIFIH